MVDEEQRARSRSPAGDRRRGGQLGSEDSRRGARRRGGDSRDRSESSRRRRGSDTSESVYEVVFFEDHNRKRYVFPYENCKSWDDAASLVEDAYVQLKDEKLIDEFRRGEFSLITEDGAVILPKVWSYVVKPFNTFSILFPSQDLPRIRWRDTSLSAREYVIRTRPSNEMNIDEILEDFPPPRPRRTVSFGVRKPEYLDEDPQMSRERRSREGSPNPDSESEHESELETESDTEVEDPAPAPVIEPIRAVLPALDKEGNKLTCTYDTKHVGMYLRPHFNGAQGGGAGHGTSGDGSDKTRNVNGKGGDMKLESLRITKATSAVAEGRTAIQVHILPGPEKNDGAEKDSVNVRWFHLHGSQLDFAQFKSTCLGITGISDRLQLLTKKTLEKIEKDRIKAFLDGMFIDPGTVFRGDEKNQNDPQSVIFSCIPYFDIQNYMKKSAGDRLFPARTLMQTYYPYEPVRDRDDDQAYRQFSNKRTDGLVYVPNMWMMNIGPDVVVTCGYQPLATEFVKSIEVVPEDLKQLGATEFNEKTLTGLRLTDWDGRILLYSLEECRSYFEMEQKLREARFFVESGLVGKSLRVAWKTPEGNKRVTPGNWSDIVKKTDHIFINLAAIDESKEKDLSLDSEETDLPKLVAALSTLSTVPPFFQWRQTPKERHGSKFGGFIPTDFKRSIDCLDSAEKAMMSETIDSYDTTNAVDRTFTSTKYYEALPEDTVDHVKTAFVSLMHSLKKPGPGCTHHQFVVNTQCDLITKKASEFTEIVFVTLKLFVSDVDKSTMLRKVWGAMKNVLKVVEKVQGRGALKSDPKEYTDENWTEPLEHKRQWSIRPYRHKTAADDFVPVPEASDEFKKTIKKCKRCNHNRTYDSPEAAFEHLRRHLASIPEDQSSKAKEPNLKDWVRNSGQTKLESNNAGALTILSAACEMARDLLKETKELAEGVRNEDGTMSERYTFPRQLLEAFRRIMVFYLAVERSLHHTEEIIDKDAEELDIEDVPYTDEGMEVLRRFGEGAQSELSAVRSSLCHMVRSTTGWDPSSRLSLGPEYICSWLMRRLLVKPVEKSMAIGDLYREYLSTLQFQVNHRPGKRMIRAINLLQEEIMILEQVNSWQTKLIDNYIHVLNDKTYEKDIPSRRAMFPYERLLLKSCLENLGTAREEYADQVRRCAPLSESAKQSAEINEEDHGKAIMVFTVVTVIFLPLSFVTSYLGMNTVDIRDMAQKQTLFWEIAIPLTVFTMGSIMFIAYTFDELRDHISMIWGKITGKQDRSLNARGISVAQRKRASKLSSDSVSTLDYKSIADAAEYAVPRPEWYTDDPLRNRLAEFGFQSNQINSMIKPEKRTTTEYWETTAAPISYAPETRIAKAEYTVPVSAAAAQTYSGAVDAWHTPLPTSQQQPTWVRINRKYLDIDTLRHYNLPWDFDSVDPEYFLIKQNLAPAEQEVLFEHTRRLREMRSGGPRTTDYANDEWYSYGGKDEWSGGYVDRPPPAHYRMHTQVPPPPPPPPPGAEYEPQKAKLYTWHKQHHGRSSGRRWESGRAGGETWEAGAAADYLPVHVSGRSRGYGYGRRGQDADYYVERSRVSRR